MLLMRRFSPAMSSGATLRCALALALSTTPQVRSDNSGDWYDNRDGGHTQMYLDAHPGANAMSSGYGAQLRVQQERVIVGNASLSYNGSLWGSMARISLMQASGARGTAQQYTSNNAYWYPAHRDLSTRDEFHAMSPAVNISEGSSGSEIDEVRKWFYTLAAFPQDVKSRLVATGLLMPTIQLLARRTRVSSDEEYLTARAHPSAFGDAHNTQAMESMAAQMSADDLPPLARLRVLEDGYDSERVIDYFDGAADEAHYTEPMSICRIFRGREYTKHLVVTAADSHDVDGSSLSYHWRILRGDASKLRIIPRGDNGEEAEIQIDYHPEATVAESGRTSNLVVVGLFVHDGTYFSAPAFVTSFTLANESREYDPTTGRLSRMTYPDNYVYPFISGRKTWLSDTFVYTANGDLLGWVRDEGTRVRELLPSGHLVTAGSLSTGVTAAKRVSYFLDPLEHTVNLRTHGLVPLPAPCTVDSTPPSIACAADRVAVVDTTCQATAPDLRVDQTVTVTDNCTETSNLTITQDPAPGTALVPGRYDITLTAVDSSGNSSSCTVACSVEDRAFLRGNVNDRRAHRLDVMDLVELIHLLFGGRTLAFDCEAALDVNDDGVHAIADVLALAQSMFQSTTYEIPEPSSVPSLVVPDGGDIPSILSCNEGEICQ